jgi:hypothetical protein
MRETKIKPDSAGHGAIVIFGIDEQRPKPSIRGSSGLTKPASPKFLAIFPSSATDYDELL